MAVITNFSALKTRLKATWMDGNYDYFSRFMESSAVEFLDRIPIPANASLLDVACGSGQLALIAARRGVRVTGVDIATNSIVAARGRAASEHLDHAVFDEGDAEALPYPDASFDVVATIYGAMFAPRPEAVASELERVCRPGGTIAMGNWTREGFIGKMFTTLAAFVAPPAMPSPLLWGEQSVVRERFGEGVALAMQHVMYRFDYPFGPAEVVSFFRKYYGPIARAFAVLDEAGRGELRSALVELWAINNQSRDPDHTVVDAEYLHVLGTRS